PQRNLHSFPTRRSSDLHRIIGRTDEEVFPPEYALLISSNDKEVIKTGKPIQVEEYMESSSGRRTFLSNKFPIQNQDGEVVSIVGDRKSTRLNSSHVKIS